MSAPRLLIAALLPALALLPASATDWPQWGGGPSRNPVSPEKGLPLDFQLPSDRKAERGITWTAELGRFNAIPPVVADGLVWIGTLATRPEDENIPRAKWDGGVLLCLRESDGKLLWKHRSPRLTDKDTDVVQDYPLNGIGSAPLVEGDRLWYVNNRAEVVCFDIGPLKQGTGEPREVWKLDMRKELGVFPNVPQHNHGFGTSVTVYKDKLYTVTRHALSFLKEIPANPEAPSLICLEKATGKVVWKDNSPGKNILQCQLSSPLVAEINGKAQVIVGQGDGWLRSFDANTGKLIWKCDLNSKDAMWDSGVGSRNHIVATPVLYENRVYVPTGRDREDADGPGCLYCIDPTKEGDVSVELDDGPNKGKPNPNSAVVWHTRGSVPKDAPRIEVGGKKSDLFRDYRGYFFGRSMGGCVAHDGLVYAADVGGVFFCFDAKTGKLHWAHLLSPAGDRLGHPAHGQLLWADGKVLVTTGWGGVFVFAHGKEKKQLAWIDSDACFIAGPVFANGTLYFTESHKGNDRLIAIRKPKE